MWIVIFKNIYKGISEIAKSKVKANFIQEPHEGSISTRCLKNIISLLYCFLLLNAVKDCIY